MEFYKRGKKPHGGSLEFIVEFASEPRPEPQRLLEPSHPEHLQEAPLAWHNRGTELELY